MPLSGRALAASINRHPSYWHTFIERERADMDTTFSRLLASGTIQLVDFQQFTDRELEQILEGIPLVDPPKEEEGKKKPSDQPREGSKYMTRQARMRAAFRHAKLHLDSARSILMKDWNEQLEPDAVLELNRCVRVIVGIQQLPHDKIPTQCLCEKEENGRGKGPEGNGGAEGAQRETPLG